MGARYGMYGVWQSRAGLFRDNCCLEDSNFECLEGGRLTRISARKETNCFHDHSSMRGILNRVEVPIADCSLPW